MLCEMRELGFHRAELSHGIRISLVPGILKAVEEKLVEVSSVHNFCPLPVFVHHAAPNFFQPSSPKSKERALWSKYSRESIEFANRIGASKLVLHSGSSRIRFSSPEASLARSNRQNPPSEKLLAKLEKKCGARSPFFKRSLQSIAELAHCATEHDIQLGIENREGIFELPLDGDLMTFLSALELEPGEENLKSPIGYWHDTGHAEIKHRKGLLDHEQLLESMAEHLIGFHLHDVNTEGRDHQVPGCGTVDFRMISRYIRPEHTVVLELNPSLTVGEVVESRERILEDLG